MTSLDQLPDDPTFGGLLAVVDADEADFPVLWAELPAPGEVGDASAWAAEAALEMARDRHFADERDAVLRLQAMLEAIVNAPAQFAGSLRLLFMAHPDLGGVLWEVVLGRADGGSGEIARQLVAADTPGDLGSDVSDYIVDGTPMLQCVRFSSTAVEDGADPGARSIVASAAVAARREVGRLGLADVVALTATADLLTLATSIEPLRLLLASDRLVELIESGRTTDF